MPTSDKKMILFAGDDQFLRDWYLKNLNDAGYLAEGTALSDLETTLARFAADLVLIDLTESESKNFLDELLPSIRQRTDKGEAYTIVFNNRGGGFKNLRENGFAEALIVPLRNLESLLGVFILLRHEQDNPWPAKVMDKVNFIGRHAALAWHNATLYANAKKLAFQDALTGLYNARYLPLAIDREIANSRESGAPFAVLFLDLDYLKKSTTFTATSWAANY